MCTKTVVFREDFVNALLAVIEKTMFLLKKGCVNIFWASGNSMTLDYLLQRMYHKRVISEDKLPRRRIRIYV